MAFTVGTVQANVGADISSFNRSMDKVRKKGIQTVRNVGQKMRSIGTAMTGALTAPLAGAGIIALKTAADYEQLEIRLNTLVGSAEKGARVFEQLKRFSAETPFQVQDIVKANNTLIGMGQSAEDAFDMVKMLGDVSSATGANISELAVTIGQASAEGRLMTRDIRELINRGVPATKLLADSMGVAKNEIFDLASQGKISFKILEKALQDATQQGGIYFEATEQAANTLKGVFSTLKDNVTFALAEIGESIATSFNLKGITKNLTENIRQAIGWFNSLSDEVKRAAFIMAGVLGASGPVLLALGTMSAAIGALISPIGAVIAAVAGIGAAFVAIAGNWEAVKERVSNVTWWRNTLIRMVQLLVEYNPFSLITKGLNKILSRFGSAQIPNLFENVADGLGKLRDDTVEYETEFKGVMGTVKSAITNLTGLNFNIFDAVGGEDTIEKFNVMGDAFSYVGNKIASIIPQTQVAKEQFMLMGGALTYVGNTSRMLFNSMSEAQKQTMKTNKAMVGAITTIGRIFDQAAIHGEKLKGVVSSILKQFASKAFINGLAMLVSGGSFSIGKLLFGSAGSIINANDAFIDSAGNVTRFSPNDSFLAMKDFGNLDTGGGSMSEKSMERAFGRALDMRLQRLGNDEIYAMAQKGKRTF